jgi:hypothetical protein
MLYFAAAEYSKELSLELYEAPVIPVFTPSLAAGCAAIAIRA